LYVNCEAPEYRRTDYRYLLQLCSGWYGHACLQSEDFGHIVDDKIGVLGGRQQQQMTTADGFVIPFKVVNGLIQMPMSNYTDDFLPHVFMTSDALCDPSKYDSEELVGDAALLSGEHVDHDAVTLVISNLSSRAPVVVADEAAVTGAADVRVETVSEFDDEDSIDDVPDLEARKCNVDDDSTASDFEDDYFFDCEEEEAQFEYEHHDDQVYSAHEVNVSAASFGLGQDTYAHLAGRPARSIVPAKADPEKLRPYFAWLPVDRIKETLKNTIVQSTVFRCAVTIAHVSMEQMSIG
jgi:hypothetical protein